LLGDLLHSENKSRWLAIENEFNAEHSSESAKFGPTPLLDQEMADCLGLAAMVVLLQRATPSFHCLKGNHDNILNSDEDGNGRLVKYIRWPGEGEIARNWTLVRLGATFAGKYSAWENRLPVFAICANQDGGLPFVASHSEPAGPYTLSEIESRSAEVVFGLTWTRNQGAFAPQVLRHIFGEDWNRSRYFASHTGSEEGIIQLPDQRLVIINKPRLLVAVLIRPDSEDFEVHIVPG